MPSCAFVQPDRAAQRAAPTILPQGSDLNVGASALTGPSTPQGSRAGLEPAPTISVIAGRGAVFSQSKQKTTVFLIWKTVVLFFHGVDQPGQGLRLPVGQPVGVEHLSRFPLREHQRVH